MTGSEMQREKEKVAAKMREKQAAGTSPYPSPAPRFQHVLITFLPFHLADAKKAGEGAAPKK